MRIAIFGAGSIGGYVGGRLAQAGADVTLVDSWHAHVMAIRNAGLRLTTRLSDETIAARCLHLSQVHALPRCGVDLAILCVKSYETEWMACLLRDHLSPRGMVLSLQNGMNEETLASVVGAERVLGCTLTRLGTELQGPGVIHRWLEPPDASYPVFRVGELHGRVGARLMAIVEVLSLVDKAAPTRNLWGERWSKLTQNAMASGICPLTHQGIHELFSSELMRPVLAALVREAIGIGEALGYSLESICGIAPEIWKASALRGDEPLSDGLGRWMRNMGPDGEPSTLHDVRRHRRTEIDAINGLIASRAQAAGLRAPMHELLCRMVRALEAGDAAGPPVSEEKLYRLLQQAAGQAPDRRVEEAGMLLRQP